MLLCTVFGAMKGDNDDGDDDYDDIKSISYFTWQNYFCGQCLFHLIKSC